ncbi:unnamed protein product, partial [Prunus brigantina]
ILGLRYALGLDRTFDRQDSKTLNFDVGLWTPIVGLPRAPGGEVALVVRSVGTVPKLGVPQVLLREFSEGDLKLFSAGNVVLPFGNPAGGGA